MPTSSERSVQPARSLALASTDANAEWAVAGAALEWPQALSEVGGDLVADDFALFEPGAIFAAARAVGAVHGYASAEPVDDLLVANSLVEAHPAIGIEEWKHQIVIAKMAAVVPRREHIDIVLRWARAREITQQCQVASESLAQSGDPTVVADRLVEQVGRVLDRDRLTFPDVVSFDNLIAPGGEADITWAVRGVITHHGRGIIVAAEGTGKALALTTPVPTTDGWSTMGDLRVGSTIFDEAGNRTRIVATTPVMLGRPCYRVTFSDGESIVADESHLWVTIPYAGRQRNHWDRQVSTTAQIAATLAARNGFVKNHLVETCGPLDYPEQDLPVDPYVLGYWLGNGEGLGARVTCDTHDVQVVDEIRNAGYTVRATSSPYTWYICRDATVQAALDRGRHLMHNGHSARSAASLVGVGRDRMNEYAKRSNFLAGENTAIAVMSAHDPAPRIVSFVEQLRELGVLGNKHIPERYLHSAPHQRLALLQGLMDSDGYVSKRGAGSGRGFGSVDCEFTTTNEHIANDVHELVMSLGIKAVMREGEATLRGRVVGKKWRIRFQSALPVFRLARKRECQIPLRTHRARVRYIVSVDPVPSVPVRCIQVDAPSGCYLVGRAMIPTHNSTLLRQIALCSAQGVHPFTGRPMRPIRTLIIDCENSASVIAITGRPLADALRTRLGSDYDSERCQVLRLDGAVDVRDPTYRRRILSRIQAVEPELVVMGPLYKIARSRPGETYEDAADDTQQALSELMSRATRPFGLLLEHHAPKRQGTSKRDFAPFGSQRWLAWPDFGFGLEEGDRIMDGGSETVVYNVQTWRGARIPLAWPDQFIRSAKGGSLLRSGMLWDARWELNGGANHPLLAADPSPRGASSNGHGRVESVSVGAGRDDDGWPDDEDF